MSQWWTYRLSSFLMFSPRTYWRLVETYNRHVWPWQPIALVAGVFLLVLVARRDARANPVVSAALAIAWLQIGWSFFWTRYGQIFTAAPLLAMACCAQAALLVVTAAHSWPPRRAWPGLLLAACGVLVYPAASALIGGRSWPTAEVAGVMPDPTAVSTIGFLLALHRRALVRVVLCTIPCIVLAIGWATLANLANYPSG